MGIARNAGYNIAGAVVPLAISIVTVPLYLEIVGIERYGILALCWLLLGFASFLNLGMGPAVAQRLASLSAAPESERSEVFWTGVWLNLALGAFGALLIYVCAGLYFDRMLRVSSPLGAEIRDSIPWLALMVPVALLASLTTGVLIGRERFLAMNVTNMAGAVLMALLPLAWAMIAGPRLDGLLLAALVGRIVALAMMIGASARAVPIRRIQPPSWRLMRKLLAFGGWVTVSSLLIPIVATIDQFAIGAMVGAAAVAVYAIPYNVVSRVSILPMSLASALFPRFAKESGDTQELQAHSVAALVAVMTPLAVALLTVIGPFLRIWLGRELADQSTGIAYILVAGYWINSTAHVPYAYLQASGRPDLVAKLHIAYVAPYLTLLYFSLSWFGIVGAAAAWSLRSCFDPVLFVLAGSFRRVLPIIAPSATIVLAATAAALIFPWTGWLHWLIMPAFFALTVLFSWHILPESAWTQIARARPGFLQRPRREAGAPAVAHPEES